VKLWATNTADVTWIYKTPNYYYNYFYFHPLANSLHNHKSPTMSSIGPDLPPHLLAKRKRQAEEVEKAEVAPVLSNVAPVDVPKSPDGAEKRRRVMGPAPPPAPLDELPRTSAHDDEDSRSSDDDYGPSIPTEQPSAVSRPCNTCSSRANCNRRITTTAPMMTSPRMINSLRLSFSATSG
jgi:hypothetical protein